MLPLTKSQSKERFHWPRFPGGPDSKASACNVGSLGQEHPLEKKMATHCSTLSWKIPWSEEPGRLRSMGSQSQTDRTERLQLELLCRKKCNQTKAELDDTFYTPTNSLSEMYGAQTPRYSKPRAQIWDVPARGMRPLVERGEKVAIV